METIRENKMEELKDISVDSLTISELKALMRNGDHKLIGDITEYTQDYVGKVLDMTRCNPLIIEVARLVLKNRQYVAERAQLLKQEYQLKRSERGI